MTAPLVSFIGPPGVGKTSLARGLAPRLGGDLVEEDFRGNPFLPGSYLGRQEACLPAQLYYLLSRAGQLSLETWPEEGIVVTDYGYCQDRIFAQAKLTPGEMGLYDQVASRVDPLIKPADVIVHLDADLETLRARIASRGRGFEQAFDDTFIQQLRSSYDRLNAPEGAVLLRLDAGRNDYRTDAGLNELTLRIRKALKNKR